MPTGSKGKGRCNAPVVAGKAPRTNRNPALPLQSPQTAPPTTYTTHRYRPVVAGQQPEPVVAEREGQFAIQYMILGEEASVESVVAEIKSTACHIFVIDCRSTVVVNGALSVNIRKLM